MAPAPILVTGFDAFGGDADNPSWRVAQALAGTAIDGVPVVAVRLPCVFGAALAVLDAAIAQHAPQCVLALGQAAGRSDLSLERIAINIDDARIADNAGRQPIDAPVVAGAPAAYFATLPIKAAVAALHAAGLPASVSQSAGTYVCNHVFYGLMHRLRDAPAVRGGFMHLPLLPGQAAQRPAGAPSMALAQQIDGARIVLQTALRRQHDLRAGGGAIA